VPEGLAHKAEWWLALVTNRAQKVGNFQLRRYGLQNGHGYHASPGTDVLKTTNTKILNVDNTSKWRQEGKEIFIWHMKRSPINKDLYKLLICRRWCNINTTKRKAIDIVSYFIRGRGKLNTVFVVRQSLDSTHPLSPNGLDKRNPNIFNGIFGN
jgi:hypothetical protein